MIKELIDNEMRNGNSKRNNKGFTVSKRMRELMLLLRSKHGSNFNSIAREIIDDLIDVAERGINPKVILKHNGFVMFLEKTSGRGRGYVSFPKYINTAINVICSMYNIHRTHVIGLILYCILKNTKPSDIVAKLLPELDVINSGQIKKYTNSSLRTLKILDAAHSLVREVMLRDVLVEPKTVKKFYITVAVAKVVGKYVVLYDNKAICRICGFITSRKGMLTHLVKKHKIITEVESVLKRVLSVPAWKRKRMMGRGDFIILSIGDYCTKVPPTRRGFYELP